MSDSSADRSTEAPVAEFALKKAGQDAAKEGWALRGTYSSKVLGDADNNCSSVTGVSPGTRTVVPGGDADNLKINSPSLLTKFSRSLPIALK